jgi:glyoxylase-like metal-dependent hydrolase (beta-lactamase superfamily II)
MAIEVYPKIFLNEIPLSDGHLKSVNSYLIPSEEGTLVIDTGFNTEEGRFALSGGLKELSISPGSTKVLITPMHPDHSGMASWLQDQGAAVYIVKPKAG